LPVQQNLAVDADDWYERAFATMFPRRLVLEVSKRVNDPTEAIQMRTMCDALRAENKPVARILSGLKTMRFEDLTEADARHPHVGAMNSTICRVNAWAHKLIGECDADTFAIGEELLGASSYKCKGGRVASNEMYTVAEVSADSVTVSAADGSLRTMTMKVAHSRLKRGYCRTGHSTQGLSLGPTLYLHDTTSCMASHRWARTAVSRCSSLNIILVTGSVGMRSNAINIAGRIAGHVASDEAKKFTWELNDYVTPAWATATLKLQQYACSECSEPLDEDWSIDRRANDLPHLKSNCSICCRLCQHSSAHRA
jgi:hypothetical protein